MNRESNKELAGRKKMKVTGFILLYCSIMTTICLCMNFKYAMEDIQNSSVGFFKMLFTKPYPLNLIIEILLVMMSAIFFIHGFFSVKYSDRFDRTTTCLITNFITTAVFVFAVLYAVILEESPAPVSVYVVGVLFIILFLVNLVGIIQNKMLFYKIID